MNPIETLTDEALLLKLRGTEHDFVERKPRGQKGEWLQVAVAFANSAPISWPAVLFVGVDDNGEPQQGPEKLEDLSKSVAAVLEQAYPPIYFDIRPLHTDGGACLAVVIPGSENRPHFTGKAYVRVGPQTKDASAAQFGELIAHRNSTVYHLLRQVGKPVMIEESVRGGNARKLAAMTGWSMRQNVEGRLKDCNQFFVTVVFAGETKSYPLQQIMLAHDHKRDCPLLVVADWNVEPPPDPGFH